MRVSISKAAEMVGVTRATLYRHIDKKGITVLKDNDDNPKIDVSELIRVYGDQVKQIPQRAANTNTDDAPSNAVEQPAAPPRNTPYDGVSPIQIEIEVLRERISRYEAEKNLTESERDRERRQLMEQIEHLQTTLAQSQEQQKRLTLLITDQRPQEAATGQGTKTQPQTTPEQTTAEEGGIERKEVMKSDARARAEARQLEVMEKTIQKLQNQNKRIYFELQKQKEVSFWKRLFG